MNGTIVNSLAIIVGAFVGIALGKRLSEKLKRIIMQVFGLSTLVIGLQMALTAKDILPILAALIIGAITGDLLHIEERIANFGVRLKSWSGLTSSSFIEGFVTASLLYVVGAMAIVGAIQDGVSGDASTLYIKSLLDCAASVALASSLGIGVAFAAVSVFIFQGIITIASSHLLFLNNPQVIAAIIATGGIMIVGISINVLELTKIRIGSLLPSLVYIILWTVCFI